MAVTRSLAARLAVQTAALLAAVGWVFAPAWHGQWLWDDALEVSDNPLLRDPSGWWKAWTGPTGLDYLPLKTDFQWIEWRLWGGQVFGYHLANVALHALGAILLWRLLAKLGAPWPWVGALLFAVHPVAVESVAWIAEFKNVVSLPLLLMSLIFFIGLLDEGSGSGVHAASTGSRSGWRYWASVGCFAASMLCKPSAVAIPVFLGVLMWWRCGGLTWRPAAALLPFLAVSIAMGLATLHFQWHRAMGLRGVPAVRPGSNEIASSFLEYVKSSLYPRHLAPVYAPVAWPWAPFAAAALLAACLVLFWTRRSRWGGAALVASSGFVLGLLPILGFIPMAYLRVSPRADHLAYIALAALAGGLAAAAGLVWRRLPSVVVRAAIGAVAVTGIGAFACISHAYAAAFRDQAALWQLAAIRQPNAWMARANWGNVLLDQGRWDAAESQLEEAARLQPHSAEVRSNLGSALQHLGRTEEALAQYRMAVQITPAFPEAHYELGRALLLDDQPGAAAEELRVALRLDPSYAEAHNNLGLALMHLGETQRAVAEYRQALALDPHLAEAHLNLGNVLFNQGSPEQAAVEYHTALREQPDYRAAHLNLSRALIALGRYDEARAELDAANHPAE